MCDIKLEDVGGENCEPTSGMVSTMYIALISDFADIKEIPTLDEPGTLETKAKITGTHTFKEGKGFTKIESVEETGTIKATPIGETGRGLFQNEMVSEVAGSDATLLGWMRVTKNAKTVVLVEEAGTGNVRQLGSRRMPCRIKSEHTVDPNVDGKNGATITMTDKAFCPAPIYLGEITMAPGSGESE